MQTIQSIENFVAIKSCEMGVAQDKADKAMINNMLSTFLYYIEKQNIEFFKGLKIFVETF